MYFYSSYPGQTFLLHFLPISFSLTLSTNGITLKAPTAATIQRYETSYLMHGLQITWPVIIILILFVAGSNYKSPHYALFPDS